MVSICSIKSKPEDIHLLINKSFDENQERFRHLLRKHGPDAENDDKQTPLQYAMYNIEGEDTLKYIRYLIHRMASSHWIVIKLDLEYVWKKDVI